MNKLFIITGPAGVGKTTISNKLASSLSKSVLIEGDTVYNFFVGGRISPWKENAPIELFWENCIYLINSYLEKGYDVVFNYIISDENLKLLKEKFKNYKENNNKINKQDYIIKEAEFVISNYISKIESQDIKGKEEYKKLKEKYKKLKVCTIAVTVVMIISFVINLI